MSSIERESDFGNQVSEGGELDKKNLENYLLIVEEHEGMRDALCYYAEEFLEDEDKEATVLEAYNGEQGFEKVKDKGFDSFYGIIVSRDMHASEDGDYFLSSLVEGDDGYEGLDPVELAEKVAVLTSEVYNQEELPYGLDAKILDKTFRSDELNQTLDNLIEGS